MKSEEATRFGLRQALCYAAREDRTVPRLLRRVHAAWRGGAMREFSASSIFFMFAALCRFSTRDASYACGEPPPLDDEDTARREWFDVTRDMRAQRVARWRARLLAFSALIAGARDDDAILCPSLRRVGLTMRAR